MLFLVGSALPRLWPQPRLGQEAELSWADRRMPCRRWHRGWRLGSAMAEPAFVLKWNGQIGHPDFQASRAGAWRSHGAGKKKKASGSWPRMAKFEKARGRRRQHSHSSGWGALRGCLWDAQKHGKNNLASMVIWPDMYMYTCYIYLEIYVSVS